jgi:hypothetical protein
MWGLMNRKVNQDGDRAWDGGWWEEKEAATQVLPKHKRDNGNLVKEVS